MISLQKGKELAKAKFLADSLTELTVNDDSNSIRLFHPDVYNFQVSINGKCSCYFGTLEQALIKVYKILKGDKIEQKYREIVSCHKEVKPNDKCRNIDLVNVLQYIKDRSLISCQS